MGLSSGWSMWARLWEEATMLLINGAIGGLWTIPRFMWQVTGGTIMVIRTGTWEDAQAPVPRDADIIMFACANSRLSVRGTVCREA